MRLKVALVILVALFVIAPAAAALETDDLLSLVAMPLAVAAVSEITGVPQSDLIDVVTLLNDAAVPPAQFVEVVRYVPVALVVEDTQPDFVQFLRTQTSTGIQGVQLVEVIEQRLRPITIPDLELDVAATRVVDVTSEEFIPVIVRSRVAEVSGHPHGGPPGQLKKQRGVQTGAEVVHSASRGRADDRGRGRAARSNTIRVDNPRDAVKLVQKIEGSDAVRAKRQKQNKGNDDKSWKGQPMMSSSPSVDSGKGKGKGQGQGQSHGKGHGHGHGNKGGGKDKGKG